MLKELFEKQRKYLNAFFDQVEAETIEVLVSKIVECKGVVFFSGVGKSGFIAHKIAATLMSSGTKASFLSPIDALHGDLGMITKHDLLLLFSKSGETEELLHLLPFVRNKGVFTCAVTSNPASRLTKGADYSIYLPCESELCPFDLAPTTSTQIQLIFGDALAVALMEAKNVSLDEFAINHPAGRIGKRATMKVRDLMLDREKSPFCLPDNLLEEVIVDFSDKRCGCLIVIDQNRQLKGIFTDGDLRRALQAKGEKVLKQRMQDLMISTPRTIDCEALAWDALKMMESDQKNPVMILPVLEEKSQEVVGVIKMHDLIQAGL